MKDPKDQDATEVVATAAALEVEAEVIEVPAEDVVEVKADTPEAEEAPKEEATEAAPIELRTASKTLVLSSDVGVRNANLLPQKALAILDYYYNNIEPRSGVMSIVIREDGRPTDHVGIAFPWVYSYAINLKRIFERCVHHIEENNSKLELRAAIWLSLIEACMHETVHVAMAFSGEEEYEDYLKLKLEDGDAEEIMESDVKDICREKLLELAKTVDIEPPPIADMGWLGGLIMAYFIEHQDDKMVRRTQRLLESGVVYEDTDEEIYHKTLRDFVKNTLAPADEEGWDCAITHVNVQFDTDAGETVLVAAEPVVAAEATVAPANTATAVVAGAEAPAVGVQALFPAAAPETGAEDAAPENAIIQQMMAAGGAAVAPAPAAPLTPAVPLAPVAAEQVALNTQAMTPPLEIPAAKPPYADKPCNLDGEIVKACMQEVYLRCYHHLFTKCGWSQNPETSRFHFAEVNGAKFSVSIQDILTRFGAEGLVAQYETVDENNQTIVEDCQGYIRGFSFRNKNIPAFKLFLNVGGHKATRSIVPQNPEKQANNAYSRAAQEAQVGHAIAYIFNGEAAATAEWKDRCPAKIVNSQYMPQT